MSRWERYKAWRARRRHEALRAWQRSQGLYIVDEFAKVPLMVHNRPMAPPPAVPLPPPITGSVEFTFRPGTRMDTIGADMEPDLGARKAARKWASSEKAADERPHLSGMVLRLCDEHEQMQKALVEIAEAGDGRAVEGLRGIES